MPAGVEVAVADGLIIDLSKASADRRNSLSPDVKMGVYIGLLDTYNKFRSLVGQLPIDRVRRRMGYRILADAHSFWLSQKDTWDLSSLPRGTRDIVYHTSSSKKCRDGYMVTRGGCRVPVVQRRLRTPAVAWLSALDYGWKLGVPPGTILSWMLSLLFEKKDTEELLLRYASDEDLEELVHG